LARQFKRFHHRSISADPTKKYPKFKGDRFATSQIVNLGNKDSIIDTGGTDTIVLTGTATGYHLEAGSSLSDLVVVAEVNGHDAGKPAGTTTDSLIAPGSAAQGGLLESQERGCGKHCGGRHFCKSPHEALPNDSPRPQAVAGAPVVLGYAGECRPKPAHEKRGVRCANAGTPFETCGRARR
jgi:hypothetical protein